VPVDGGDQLRHPCATDSHRLHDRRPPALRLLTAWRRVGGQQLAVMPAPGLAIRAQVEHSLQGANRILGLRAVGLVDDEDVGDLQDAGLDRLHIVPQSGRLHDQGGLRLMGDIHFALARADRLDENGVEAGGIQRADGVGGGAGQPAQTATGGHAADEDAGIASQVAHADAVAQDRAAGEGAGRVYGDDADRLAPGAVGPGQGADQRAFARARRAGHTDQRRPPGMRIQRRQRLLRLPRLVLNGGQQAGQRPPVALQKLRNQDGHGCSAEACMNCSMSVTMAAMLAPGP